MSGSILFFHGEHLGIKMLIPLRNSLSENWRPGTSKSTGGFHHFPHWKIAVLGEKNNFQTKKISYQVGYIMLYKSRFYTIKHELSPVSIHMFQLNLISNADIIHVEGADSHHFISINLGKWCLTQNPLTHEKCCSHMLHHEWSHEITIWLFDKAMENP